MASELGNATVIDDSDPVGVVGAGTVNTMPEKTLQAVADHAEIEGDKVSGAADDAQETFDQLAAVGIDLDDVVALLEREGVKKFDASWAELVHTVQTALEEAGQGKDSPAKSMDAPADHDTIA